MTLDEIIAGMEHEQRWTQLDAKVCCNSCTRCHLVSFRTELEAMAQRWDEEADKRYFAGARSAFQNTAAELRAKIGEGK